MRTFNSILKWLEIKLKSVSGRLRWRLINCSKNWRRTLTANEKQLKQIVGEEVFDRILEYADASWSTDLDYLMTKEVSKPSDILEKGFVWTATPEGFDHWQSIYETVKENENEDDV
jgi:hypothetical protein